AATSCEKANLPRAAWRSGVAVVTSQFAIGQTIGPVGAGWISDRWGSLSVGLGVSAALQFAGALVALSQRPGPQATAGRTLRRNRFRLQTHAGIRNRLGGGAQAGEHVLDEFSYRANGVTERQLVGATEEQAAVDVARERIGQAGIDTKLALLGNAVAQATLSQAVERHGAGLDLGNAQIGRASCREDGAMSLRNEG